MTRRIAIRLLSAVVAAVPLGFVAVASTATTASAEGATHRPHPERAVCGQAPAGRAACHAHVLLAADGVTPDASMSPTGLPPGTIKSAYNFPTSTAAGSGQTIAIVDAFDDPSAQADLATFSSQYGLPCNGCLTKVSQTGDTTYPSPDGQWALEISLDVQWAHAIAPGAHLLLVEARSTSINDLMTAEGYAANHANYVSNSWGGSEISYEWIWDGNFVKSGVSFFVAAGDSGLGAEYPSSSPNVISVGGTQLNGIVNNVVTPNFSETAWSGGGGGCSSFETAPPAQSGFSQYGQVNCAGKRATPDVALDAAPNSGVSVFDTTSYFGQQGWFTVGGTSAGSPMWAARSAVEGALVNAGYVYGNNITFRDITSGSNGAPAMGGFDLATGRGSWITSAPAPGTPTLVSATGGVNSVALSWSAPTTGGPVASYNIYRGGSGPVSLVASGVGGTSYTDTVSPGTYSYQVTAVNGTGTEGPPSNQLSATATAPPPAPPGPPTLNSATGGVGSVALSWSAPTTGGTANTYKVYRGNSSGSETQLASGITGTTFTDNVAPGTYFYQVTGVNSSAGEGTRSNELSGTSTAPAPGKPGPPQLNTANGGVGTVALAWSAPTTGGTATSYNVYRGTSSGAETLLASGISGTTFTDNTTGTFFYEVTGVNAGGEGSRSNELSATATAPVDEAPTVSFTRACTYSACTFTSNASDPDGSISRYSWTGGNNLTGSSSRVTHGYTTTGTFAVNITIVDSSGQQATSSGSVTCARDSYQRLVCS